MNIFIIGAGAIGTYLAAVISREYDVTLVGKKDIITKTISRSYKKTVYSCPAFKQL